MNSLFKNMQINQLSGRLRQIAGTPNVLSMQFSAVDVAGIRESIITIANECKADDPQIARQLLAAKDILFAVNQFGQAFINPYAIGEILFGLDYLAAKGQAPSAEKQTTAEIWSYIHPLIQKSSKKLFEDPYSSLVTPRWSAISALLGVRPICMDSSSLARFQTEQI